MKLDIDFTKQNGRIRALNGSNLGPKLSSRRIYDERPDFKSLRIPLCRLHDAPLMNPGMRLVDIHHIFGNWHADENDPRNYYFKQTDDYIRSIRECGTDILYRLGPSIEHSLDNYYAFPPADFDKWTRICINIIRHYNEGWADGFSWDIKYWEIWNEPNARPHQWSGSDEEYFKLYSVVATAIKKRFPQIKVGGPALSCPEHGKEPLVFCNKFLAHCSATKTPLDFYSWHSYPSQIARLREEPFRVRGILDKAGFAETELHLNEWHPSCAPRDDYFGLHGMNGIESAVYASNILASWQDSPMTMANYYYTTSAGGWGIYDLNHRKMKTFFALLALAKMLDYPERVKSQSPDPDVSILSGRNSSGKRAFLISAYNCNDNDFEFGFDLAPFTILILDEKHDLTECTGPIRKSSQSALWLAIEK